ncbi:MAG: hypothetical protein JNK04_00455, partial [Myxococcales bacterium]|nr:hypothetical protein [Myxococcales bacterium]
MSRGRAVALAASFCLVGCVAPSEEARAPLPADRAVATDGARPPPSIDGSCQLELVPVPVEAQVAAPAYLVTRRGLVRVDAAGGRTIKEVPRATPAAATIYTTPRYFAGPESKLWMSRDDGLYVLDPSETAPRKVAPALDRKWLKDLVVRSNTEIWALAIEGEVASRSSTSIAHFDGSAWRVTDAATLFGEGPPPFDLVATRDALWVSTAKGLWRGGPTGWQLVDPVAPFQIHASADRIAGDIAGELHVRDGSWQKWPFLEKANAGQIAAVGASGLIAWTGAIRRTDVLGPWPGGGLGSLQGACRWQSGRDARGDAVSFYTGSTIDGSDRVWVPGYNGFRVVSARGTVLADYRSGMLDGLTSDVLSVVVPGGGPTSLPAPLPRRSLDVVGRLEIGKGGRALAGATVEIAIGDSEARNTTTAADGS